MHGVNRLWVFDSWAEIAFEISGHVMVWPWSSDSCHFVETMLDRSTHLYAQLLDRETTYAPLPNHRDRIRYIIKDIASPFPATSFSGYIIYSAIQRIFLLVPVGMLLLLWHVQLPY